MTGRHAEKLGRALVKAIDDKESVEHDQGGHWPHQCDGRELESSPYHIDAIRIDF